MEKISIDRAKHRVIIVFGTALEPDHGAWERRLFAACEHAKGNGTYFDMLCDFTALGIMRQTSADDSARTVKWCVDNGLRKAANVVGSALMNLQLTRVSATDKIQNFATVTEAQAWLAE